MEEDAVEEEATDQIIPTLSTTNVTNLVTMRMIVTATNVDDQKSTSGYVFFMNNTTFT